MDRVEKFNKFEKIFFRIEIVILIIGILFLTLFKGLTDQIGAIADTWITVFFAGWFLIVANFFTTVVRIFIYLFNIRKLEGKKSIWRSILVLLLSPIAFMLYYLLIFITAISGCAAL